MAENLVMFMVPIKGQRGKASPKITYIKAPIQEAKNTLSCLSETLGQVGQLDWKSFRWID